MEELTEEMKLVLIKNPIQMAMLDRVNLVPIVGAGASLSLGLPNWQQLIQNLTRRAGIDLKTSITEEPPDILQDIKQRLGDITFTASIQHELRLDRASTSTALQALTTAPIGRIITTNLDFAIEVAFSKAGKPLPPENVGRGYSKEELALFERQSSEPILLKIHGSLERPASWVLTRKDYDTAYVHPGNLKEFFSTKNSIPLFIGFSFSDFDVNEGLRLASLSWYKKAYTIIPIKDARKLETRLKNIGVIPIGFFEFDQIPEIIDEIFRCSPLSIEFRFFKKADISPRLKIGGADIEVPSEIWDSQEKRDRVTSLLTNAFEIQPNESILDGRARRIYGRKGWYREEILGILKVKDVNLLQLVFKAMIQYPEILFEGLTGSILKMDEADHFQFFRTFFDAIPENLTEPRERMDRFLLSNVHNSEFGYKCLRAIANILAWRGLHPAMKIPPPSVQVGKLLVPIYPLTRYQVGVLTENLTLKSEHLIWPYTLHSPDEANRIIKKLRDATNQKWRLPSSGEWLGMTGINDENPWPWGKNPPEFKVHAHLKYADLGGNVARHPLEVGIFPKGQSLHGVFDLIGNVYEILLEYISASISDNVLAGGAWTTAFHTRMPERFHPISGWGFGRNNIGIRPVLDVS